jgi:hypothetical protein
MIRRHGATFIVITLSATIVLLSPHVALGAQYLACVDKNMWTPSYIEHRTSWYLDDCYYKCKDKRYPLLGLALQDTACMCGAIIPNGAHQLKDEECQIRSANATAIYYVNHGERPIMASIIAALSRRPAGPSAYCCIHAPLTLPGIGAAQMTATPAAAWRR